jgi:predicted NUDIX family NTP pyrophosphohydrolase
MMFRRTTGALEVLLVHPGGPFFARKDIGTWTTPKGEAAPGEDLLTRARVEFEEELGVPADGDFISLGSVRQKGGKLVHAWAFEGNLPTGFEPESNFFELEWPPRSGKRQKFPEVDKAQFFPEEIARKKINPAQEIFIDRLGKILTEPSS